MRLIAPVTIRTSLTGLAGRYTLRLLATPVFNIGDGIQMDVLLGNGRDENVVYRRYFDAARRAEDRNWILLQIPIDLDYRDGQELKIRVSGGPRGDLVADWLALAEMEFVKSD